MLAVLGLAAAYHAANASGKSSDTNFSGTTFDANLHPYNQRPPSALMQHGTHNLHLPPADFSKAAAQNQIKRQLHLNYGAQEELPEERRARQYWMPRAFQDEQRMQGFDTGNKPYNMKHVRSRPIYNDPGRTPIDIPRHGYTANAYSLPDRESEWSLSHGPKVFVSHSYVSDVGRTQSSAPSQPVFRYGPPARF